MNLALVEKFFVTWTRWVERNARWVLLSYLPILAASVYLVLTQLGMNADLTDMISDKLEFHKNWKAYKNEFPDLNDTLFVVIDGQSVYETRRAAKWLIDELESHPHIFKSSLWLNGGEFFDKNAFLFQPQTLDDLQENKLSEFFPLLYGYANSPDLNSFFDSVAAVEGKPEAEDFIQSVAQVVGGGEQKLSFFEYFSEASARQYIEIKPVLDFSNLLPSESAVLKLKSLTSSYSTGEIGFGITGPSALSYEEMKSVSEGASLSGILSLIFVSIILFFALRYFKLIGLTLLQLIVGLLMTGAFAAVAVGHLNMISVAFAVLFIGLGVDYSIHLCMRYREELFKGSSSPDALVKTMSKIGSSLVLCTVTTAVGFLAFVPTAYAGVSELGIISGGGMFINFFVHITLFPAFLSMFPADHKLNETTFGSFFASKLAGWAYKNALWVRGFAVGVVLLALPFSYQVQFDSNPLNLQDPTTEAYQTYQKLLSDPSLSPWTIKVMAENETEEEKLIAKLMALPEVGQVLASQSFIPSGQKEVLQKLMRFQLPELKNAESEFKRQKWVDRFSKFADEKAEGEESWRALSNSLSSSTTQKSFLQAALIEPSNDFYLFLQNAFSAQPLSFENLPRGWKNRFVSDSGMRRIEVFPSSSLLNVQAMESFSEAVLEIAPEATDDPVTLPRSGEAVVDAFIQALLLAGVAILVLLYLMTGSLKDSFLVFVPLLFSAILIKAVMFVFQMPFNFANIIVIPLLLGIGVDSGVHLLHRFRSDPFGVGAATGSTERAIFFSALTTIASFGTLMISSHRGTASMGVLLSLGTAVVMLATLIILPALLSKSESASIRKAA